MKIHNNLFAKICSFQNLHFAYFKKGARLLKPSSLSLQKRSEAPLIKMENKSKISKIYAFIDASNIIYGCTRAGWKMDFEKLARYLKTRYNVQRLLYYGGVDAENRKQLKFYELLQRLGYEVRWVPMKHFLDGTRKADIDSRMTFEIMRYLNEYDGIIVCTGDGDFFWVLEYLHKEKKIPLRYVSP